MTSKAFSEVEGRLVVAVDGEIIFDEENILLVEFYAAILAWVSLGGEKDFIYRSMDYEEEPILHAGLHGGSFSISSIWACENIKSPVEVESREFVRAARSFIERFESELPEVKNIC